ncbi:BTAD domain-containing putative transcriptional regulator [Streptomyces sp. NPDC002659]|uniref:AfsR/SARP family transcriptional regulator n=1 Tax=Streptomyces sp. NPDC002659 TaxID=3364656 RepID=UPI0036C32D25
MRFNILGPLQVEFGDDRSGHVQGKKQLLLAALLLRANRSVSVDQISELMWGAEPPRSAVRNIRTYVWQLRSCFGFEGSRIVVTESGYLLSVLEGELDLEEFERLLRDGRALLMAGKHSESAIELEKALTLWRGSPFGSAYLSDALRVEAAWISEKRISAFEDLMNVMLALGRHREVVERVTLVLRDNKLRESLHRIHIVALSRSERQADALKAYRALRNLLSSELAIEPCPALQALHHDLLEGNPV